MATFCRPARIFLASFNRKRYINGNTPASHGFRGYGVSEEGRRDAPQ